MRSLFSRVILTLGLLGLLSASRAHAECAADLAGTLRMHGSNTIGAELAPALYKAFAACAKLPGEEVTKLPDPVERIFTFTGGETDRKIVVYNFAHGSDTAPPDLAAGNADIGMMSRRINEGDIAKLVAAGFDRPIAPPNSDPNAPQWTGTSYEYVVALDGIAVLINAARSSGPLSICQVARMFSGRIRDWQEVGSAPGATQVYARDENSGTWDTFNNLVMKPCGEVLTKFAKRYEENGELSRAVELDRNAIGFTGVAYIGNNGVASIVPTLADPTASSCHIQMEPTDFLIKAAEYPLARRLYFYAPVRLETGLSKAFINFVQGPEGQDAVRQAQFVNRDIIGGGLKYTAQRIDEASQPSTYPANVALKHFGHVITNAERLSTTIRFETSSYDIKPEGIDDINRLKAMWDSGVLKGHQIILAGFTDSRGSWDMNLRLSINRVNSVAREFVNRQIPVDIVDGFGLILPVACNENEAGWQYNRRVEIWISPPFSPPKQ